MRTVVAFKYVVCGTGSRWSEHAIGKDTGVNVQSAQNDTIGSADVDLVNGSGLKGLSNTFAANKTKYYRVNSHGGSNDLNEGATGWNAMAMGQNSIATGTQTISIGSRSGGQKTTASGEQSIAIGANVVSKGASFIAIGGDDLEEASKANLNGGPVLDI